MGSAGRRLWEAGKALLQHSGLQPTLASGARAHCPSAACLLACSFGLKVCLSCCRLQDPGQGRRDGAQPLGLPGRLHLVRRLQGPAGVPGRAGCGVCVVVVVVMGGVGCRGRAGDRAPASAPAGAANQAGLGWAKRQQRAARVRHNGGESSSSSRLPGCPPSGGLPDVEMHVPAGRLARRRLCVPFPPCAVHLAHLMHVMHFMRPAGSCGSRCC